MGLVDLSVYQRVLYAGYRCSVGPLALAWAPDGRRLCAQRPLHLRLSVGADTPASAAGAGGAGRRQRPGEPDLERALCRLHAATAGWVVLGRCTWPILSDHWSRHPAGRLYRLSGLLYAALP